MPSLDRTLDEATLSRMVARLDDGWTLQSAELTALGTMPVYVCRVEMNGVGRDCVLKATPPDAAGTDAGLEARLYALLDRHTGLPVPTVHATVDGAESLPTPYFLMEKLPGNTLHLGETGRLSRPAHRRFARESGRALAALHAVDAVDAFGFLAPVGPDPAGDPPRGDPADVAVVDPTTDWPGVVDGWAGDALEHVAGSRFEGLVPGLEAAVDERLADVPTADGRGTHPVLARVDHGVHNVTLDVETGETLSVLDLGFTLAATPAYDLVCVAETVAGGVWAFHTDVPDRRSEVHRWVREGYEDTGGRPTAELDAAGDLYELLSLARSMGFFDDQFVENAPGDESVPAEAREAAAADLRAAAEALL